MLLASCFLPFASCFLLLAEDVIVALHGIAIQLDVQFVGEQPCSFRADAEQVTAILHVVRQRLAEVGGEFVDFRQHDDGVIAKPSGNLMLRHYIHRIAARQQCVKRAVKRIVLARPRTQDVVRLIVERRRREQQRHLRHTLAFVGDGLPGAAKIADLAHHVDEMIREPSGARRRVVNLEAPTLRQHHGRLLLQLHSSLVRAVIVCAIAPPREAPRHQIPRHSGVRDVARLETRRVDRILRAVVAGDEVDGRFHRTRHKTGVHPVARDLQVGIEGVQLIQIVREVRLELLAVEFQPLMPVRLFGRTGRVIVAAGRLPCGESGGAVIRQRSPALAIDPRAIKVVSGEDLFELRDQQFVHVGAEGAGDALEIRLALRRDPRPLRVMLDSHAIPHAGVVNEELDTVLLRDLAPECQRVPHDAGRCPTDLRRITGVAGMALAVLLYVVGLDPLQQPGDHGLGHIRAQFRVVFARVQIEVKSEKCVFTRYHRVLLRK